MNVPSKQQENSLKYCLLALDFRLKYKVSVNIVPVVSGYTSVASADYITHLRDIPEFCDSLLTILQKATLTGAVHTLPTINLA